MSIVDLSEARDLDAVERTLAAMRAGTDVIVQPALRDGRWFGRPDLLRRVAVPSALGAWSYEVFDTKLARETRGGTVLQVSLYSDLLGIAQAMMPEGFHVVTPHPSTRWGSTGGRDMRRSVGKEEAPLAGTY